MVLYRAPQRRRVSPAQRPPLLTAPTTARRREADTVDCMTVEALILDMGEVLVRAQSPEWATKMATIASLPPEEFTRRYWAHREAYDGGLTGPEYWHRVLDQATAGDDPRISDLIQADCESWTEYVPEVWEIAAAFKAAGGRTAMLSNGVIEIIGRVRRDKPLKQYFDAVVVSCEVGCAKPNPAIYRLCLGRLGVEPGSALFVDDRLPNLTAARKVGLQTLHFQGDRSVGELKARLGKGANGARC
jgi:putative hydrolase of the HAD superfamily